MNDAIPESAIDAAAVAYLRHKSVRNPVIEASAMRAALEAAAPHMLNQSPPVAEGPSEGADAVTGFPRAAYRKRRMG